MTNAKQKAKERDGWECQFCGMDDDEHQDEYGRGLHAHHIVKDADGGADAPRNLITVCQPCHNTLERTQADALSRIKNNQPEAGQVEEWKQKLYTERENMKSVLHGVDALIDISLGHDIYIVHETRYTTSRLLYVGGSLESAKEAFENAENHATMETATVSASEWVADLSDTDVDRVRQESDILADRIRDHRSERQSPDP
jgi:hypothetical protein